MRVPKQHDIKELRELFSYDPDSGGIYRIKDAGKMKAGARAERESFRYLVVKIPCLYELPAHRVAWAIHFGEWPKFEIDHINGNPIDNRIENLRDVPHIVNLQNRRSASVNSKTGVLGVSESASRPGMFRADIHVDGKQRLIGHFKTIELAKYAYISAKRDLHSGCTI